MYFTHRDISFCNAQFYVHIKGKDKKHMSRRKVGECYVLHVVLGSYLHGICQATGTHLFMISLSMNSAYTSKEKYPLSFNINRGGYKWMFMG